MVLLAVLVDEAVVLSWSGGLCWSLVALPPVLVPSWSAVLADEAIEPIVLDVAALPGPSLVVGAAEADAVAVLVDVAVVLSWSGGLCWCMVAPLA